MIQASDPQMVQRLVSVLATTAVVAGVAIFVIRMKGREHDKRQAIWRRFALDNRLNLTVEPDSWLKLGTFKITGRIGELDLELSTYRVQVGKATQTWVRASSRGKGPDGSFSVRRANFLTRAGALLGTKGEAIDEGKFDEEFLTRSEPASLARDVLDAPLRAHFTSLTRSPRLEYANGRCEMNWQCGKDSLEQLAAAVGMLAMLHGAFARLARV